MRSLTRRALLRSGALGTAAVTLAGCAGEEPGPAPAPPPDPETVLLRQLIEEKERTVALYAALPSRRLAPFRRRHEAHLAELRRRLPAGNVPEPAAPASPSASPSASGSPSPGPRPSLRKLRELERTAAALRPRQTEGVSPALAQLIACIGACEAAHAVALPRSL
ncbi:hypothetical protein [Planomonospora parontospora]|uniref:hypothetical protein n=1 Tax=Planomonospora parontospora TaxID=58119 RepID=UPI0016710209|nr:hypothetical protein [Planomonospora parontospora]GGL21693.1 hypothetical protein GCM10014719_24630 [Planomonospora parontospora subsp. antibiotica]GII15760.1 hypothetical protein Ppa05_24860 [Planomonospora parontospora subsp. antibiotica]